MHFKLNFSYIIYVCQKINQINLYYSSGIVLKLAWVDEVHLWSGKVYPPGRHSPEDMLHQWQVIDDTVFDFASWVIEPQTSHIDNIVFYYYAK